MLALAVGLGLAGMTAMAWGQATTGAIFGRAPAGSNTHVLIRSASGLTRKIPVDASGHYNATSLPLGTYTVSLLHNGKTVQTHSDVTLRVGAGTEVDFAAPGATANAQNLATVQVTANALPAIDVSSVDSRTVVTSEQMAKLPLARSAEAVALLAPGAISGSGYFSGPTGNALVSFSGSSVTENAYYINGFNTTDPLNGFGGVDLPYGAMAQEQLLSGGYGAAYGRSDGGVINMVGKHGTNVWHFGGQVLWTPEFAKGNQRDVYYVSGDQAGQLYNRNTGDKTWTTTEDAYVGGPLIKDRLFLFFAVEAQRTQGSSVGSILSPYKNQYRYDDPKTYAKLDWNINSNNILELTYVSNKDSYQGSLYDYDYANDKEGSFVAPDTHTKTAFKIYTAKFTSYITDNLTLSALYGKMKGTYFSQTPGYDPTVPYTYNADKENPAITHGALLHSSQTIDTLANPKHSSTNTNLRVDLSYRLGNHTLSVGIDNQNVGDFYDGVNTSGPDYAWEYMQGDPNTYIMGTSPTADPWVDAPGKYPGGKDGYYVNKYSYNTAASAHTTQRAQYIEDSWQVTSNLLLKLGLRNDQFTNYNPSGEAYLRLTSPQWAPRLGFSWDVHGDSSLKIYGNAGRYYLALPSHVALRVAGAPRYTRESFTYTGISSDGTPTGLTAIKNSRNGPVSPNGEYGQGHDARIVGAVNLESEYQDEFILGFDQQLSKNWIYGAKATFRKLENAIDDVGDTSAIIAKMDKMGIDPGTYDGTNINGAYMFNPGKTNTFRVPKFGGGYYLVPMTNADYGFPPLKRNYYGLNLYLEHPFDGTWYGKIDYLYSRSYGNTEGQVRTDIGQSDVSATVDWDYKQVMEYSDGDLANSRRHQIKAYGYYQITPEWLVSGNLSITSGAPRSCLGYYGPKETNPGLGYSGGYYHWCGGQPSPPGAAGHNPWQYILSLGVDYHPAWADHKLGFQITVHNVLNNRVVTQTDPFYGFADARDSTYKMAVTQSTPRYVRFGITYDF
ncbi:MAG TPA: TonB-dependent receptor [Rhodanobacteraceae bacterium]